MEASAPPRHRAATLRPPDRLRACGDDELVRLVRLDQESAFEEIYERHHRGILSFCRHMLGSRDEGEDAVQHTFIAAYRDLRRSNKPIHLKAWLYTIARNRCLSMLRARREQVALEDVEPATEGLAAEVQLRQDLRDMLLDLRRLPDDQRAALVLSELGALSHEEIAMTLDVRKDKVKALVFQARESLATARQARNTDCSEIQQQLSVLRGGSLRRATLRRHLEDCPSCQSFRDEVRRQRAAMALILPVTPTVGLKGTAIAGALSAGGVAAGGAAGGAALGGAAAAGGTAAGGGLGAKLAVGVAVLGVATGGGAISVDHRDPPARKRAAPPPAIERPSEASTQRAVATLRSRAEAAGTQREADLRSSAKTRRAAPATTARKRKADRPSAAADEKRGHHKPRANGQEFGHKDGTKGGGENKGFEAATPKVVTPSGTAEPKQEKLTPDERRADRLEPGAKSRGRGPGRLTPSGLLPPRHTRPARPVTPAADKQPAEADKGKVEREERAKTEYVARVEDILGEVAIGDW